MTDPLDEPVGYLALPRGTPVVAVDGTPVGTVHQVRHHERERIFDGLVVETETGRRFVDAPEVGSMTRRKVELTITARQLAHLPEVGGTLGAIDSGARRFARKFLRRPPGANA